MWASAAAAPVGSKSLLVSPSGYRFSAESRDRPLSFYT